MTDFSAVKKNLEAKGFRVSTFETAQAAADYLNGAIDGVSVGFGGSVTLDQMGLYDRLAAHNNVIWHWKTEDKLTARYQAMTTDMYITSANGHQYRRHRQPGGRHPVRPQKGVVRGGPQQAGSHL